MNLQRYFHQGFRLGMVLKAIDGALEIIGGVLFLTLSQGRMNQIVVLLTQHELSEDPNDLIANVLANSFRHLGSATKIFAAIYLLLHGSVKIFLVVQLLREKLWAFPVALVLVTTFLFYQAYRLSIHFSLPLLGLTVFDAAIICLIGYEYRSAKRLGSQR